MIAIEIRVLLQVGLRLLIWEILHSRPFAFKAVVGDVYDADFDLRGSAQSFHILVFQLTVIA